MLKPGPDHPITLEPAASRWRAKFAGHVIADSNDALILNEKGHAPVVYFPRQDVAMEYMSRQERTTHCPYKGDASYYHVTTAAGDTVEDAIWTYQQPYPAVADIAGHVAFYPTKAEISLGA